MSVESLVLGILGILAGGFVGFYYLKTRIMTPYYKNQMIKDLEETIKSMQAQLDIKKAEIQKLHGTIGNIRAKQKIQIETDPGEDPKAAILETIDALKDQLDPRLQKLLNNPTAMEFLVNQGYGLYQKYPKQAEQLLGAFLPQFTKLITNKDSAQNNKPQATTMSRL